MKSRVPFAERKFYTQSLRRCCCLSAVSQAATLQVVSLPIAVFTFLSLLLDTSQAITKSTMHASNLRATFAAGLAVVSRAQQDRDNNAAVDISSCNEINTVDLNAGAVCKGGQTRATGVELPPMLSL